MTRHHHEAIRPVPPLRSHAERLIVLTLTAPGVKITTVREPVANLIPFLSAQRLTDGLVGLLQRGYLAVEDDGQVCGSPYWNQPWPGLPTPAGLVFTLS